MQRGTHQASSRQCGGKLETSPLGRGVRTASCRKRGISACSRQRGSDNVLTSAGAYRGKARARLACSRSTASSIWTESRPSQRIESQMGRIGQGTRDRPLLEARLEQASFSCGRLHPAQSLPTPHFTYCKPPPPFPLVSRSCFLEHQLAH
jgi:hypothetical protein